MTFTFSRKQFAEYGLSTSWSGLFLSVYSIGGLLVFLPFVWITSRGFKTPYMLHGLFIFLGNLIMLFAFLGKMVPVVLVGRIVSGMEVGIKYTSKLAILRSVPQDVRAYWLAFHSLAAGAGLAAGPAVTSLLVYATGPLASVAPNTMKPEIVPNYFMVVYGALFMVFVVKCFPVEYEQCKDVDAVGGLQKTDGDLVFYKYTVMVSAMFSNCTRVLIRIGWEAGALVILEVSYAMSPENAGLVCGSIAFSIVIGRTAYMIIGKYFPDELLQVSMFWIAMLCTTVMMYPFVGGLAGLVWFLVGSTFNYNFNLLRSAPTVSFASANTMPERFQGSKECLTFWSDINDLLGIFLGPVILRYALDQPGLEPVDSIRACVKCLAGITLVDGVLTLVLIMAGCKVRELQRLAHAEKAKETDAIR